MRKERNKFYTDGAVSQDKGIGTYCIVIAAYGKPVDWYVKSKLIDDPIDIEYAALIEAIELAEEARQKNDRISVVYCDSLAAIVKAQKRGRNVGVRLQYIPHHLAKKEGSVIDDDVKRHHWADVMASGFLQELMKKGIDKYNMSIDTKGYGPNKGPEGDQKK